MTFIEPFEEIMVLQIDLGLFLIQLESGIKDIFDIRVADVRRGCSFKVGSPQQRYRNTIERLTHDEVSGRRGDAGVHMAQASYQ